LKKFKIKLIHKRKCKAGGKDMKLKIFIFLTLFPLFIFASEVKKVVIDLRTGDLKT